MKRIMIASLATSMVLATSLAAQDFRGSATSGGRYIQIRPIVRDTVPMALVKQRVDGTFYEGVPVTCLAGFAVCVRHIAGEVQHAIALTQDVSVTAWGLGMQGLSATLLVRARADASGDFAWPRSDDAFDAMLAYLELDRGPWRVRAGRQRSTSGLGFSGFDGVSALVAPHPRLQIEAYGGRSLARGLNEPRNEALQGIESFLLDRDAWLLGAAGWFEPWAGGMITARYQREIWSDRSGLLAERASIDLRTPLPGPFSLGASADYDFAFGRIGKASAAVRAPLFDDRSLWLELHGRRYVPYFELWTIWGFFSPAAWHEAELRALWRATPSLMVRGHGGWRWYGDTETPVVLSELPDDGQRLGLGASWQATPDWTLDGEYTLEKGYGAFLSSARVLARWQATQPLSVTLDGSAFQQIEEFRVGEGAVLGGGVAIGWEFSSNVALDGGVNVYRQNFENRPGTPDWNQVRGWASLRIGFGRDPGLASVGR